MIDLALLRNPATAATVRESEKKRGRGTQTVDNVVELIEQRVKMRFAMEQLNKQFNALTRETMVLFKGDPGARDTERGRQLLAQGSQLKEKKAELQQELGELEKETALKAGEIGNLVHKDVFVSGDEAENPVLETVQPSFKQFHPPDLLPYDSILLKLGAADQERGIKVAGHRGYFLKDAGLLFALSLSRYALDFLKRKGYALMQTPFFMNKAVMAKTAQLSDFDEQLYKIEGGPSEAYLIATSEQPISAFHAEEWLTCADLPLKYGGYSTCFRKEAGAHGKDNRGLFRVHQFEKVEQFVICAPEDSQKHFEDMVAASKEFYESLGIGFQVVSIVSGALNNAASIKYDIEALFPASKRYRELVSCSNCLDYQSRDLEVRYEFRDTKNEVKKYVHMLNGTLCAVQRTMCCILENYQTEHGVVVPDALIPYFGDSFIPYKH